MERPTPLVEVRTRDDGVERVPDKKALADLAEAESTAMIEAADRALAEGEEESGPASVNAFLIENAHRRGGAEIFAHSGFLFKARWIYRKALNDAKARVGADHPETRLARKDLDDFEDYYAEALREAPAEDDVPPMDASTEMQLSLGERNLADLVRTQGPTGPRAAMARTALVEAYVVAGRPAEASRLLAEVGWTYSVGGLTLPYPKPKREPVAPPPQKLLDRRVPDLDLAVERLKRVLADGEAKPKPSVPEEVVNLGEYLNYSLRVVPPPDKHKFAEAVTNILSKHGYSVRLLPDNLLARKMYVNTSGALMFKCTDSSSRGMSYKTPSGSSELRRFELVAYKRQSSKKPSPALNP